MKKVLKIFGIIVGVIIILALAGFIYINSNEIPYYDIKRPTAFQVKSTPEAIERGHKLASMLCAGCHLNRETGKLTGVRMLEAPAEFGEIYSQNITQDKTYGIGNWTDEELVTLFRTGIKKNGQYSPPYMAKLPLMADDDINAIISFLRSDDPMVTADATPDTPCKPSFLTKFLCKVAFKPLPMPTQKIAMPDSTNTKELGEYLAHNLDCFSCHSNDFKTNDFMNPKLSKGYFAGGNQPLDKEGRVMLTPNLTPDKETGIGNWTKEDFIKAVRFGIKKEDKALVFPMVPYTQLTDYEAGAIYDYLQTIPPIKNKVERSVY